MLKKNCCSTVVVCPSMRFSESRFCRKRSFETRQLGNHTLRPLWLQEDCVRAGFKPWSAMSRTGKGIRQNEKTEANFRSQAEPLSLFKSPQYGPPNSMEARLRQTPVANLSFVWKNKSIKHIQWCFKLQLLHLNIGSACPNQFSERLLGQFACGKKRAPSKQPYSKYWKSLQKGWEEHQTCTDTYILVCCRQ